MIRNAGNDDVAAVAGATPVRTGLFDPASSERWRAPRALRPAALIEADDRDARAAQARAIYA